MKYTINYFIKKFKAIPTEEIGAGRVDVAHCALWHCGVRESAKEEDPDWITTPEAEALGKILKPIFKANINPLPLHCVYHINDGIEWSNLTKYGKLFKSSLSPKDRVLAALEEMKKLKTKPKVSKV